MGAGARHLPAHLEDHGEPESMGPAMRVTMPHAHHPQDHTGHLEGVTRSDEILVPALQAVPVQDPELLARIRHPSFQAGLAIMLQGDRPHPECPVGAEAGPYNHTRDCTCLKRSLRPG